MRLLSKKEITNKKQVVIAKELVVAQKASVVIEDTRKRLNEAKVEDNVRRYKIDVDFVKYQKDTRIKKTALGNEVASLENRKKEALKPVTELKKEAQKQFDTNIITAETLDKEKEKLDIKTIQLDKTKKGLKDQANKLTIKEGVIKTDTEEVDKKKSELKTKQKDFSKYQTAEENTLEQKGKDIKKKASDVEIERKKVVIKEVLLVKRNKEVDTEWIKIADQRATLKRAYARIKK